MMICFLKERISQDWIMVGMWKAMKSPKELDDDSLLKERISQDWILVGMWKAMKSQMPARNDEILCYA
jgi:hypothetical protein